MNGRHLGKMVRSLRGLASWMSILRQNGPASPLPYQARDCTPAFSWYLPLLRVCPRLVDVNMFFTSSQELAKVLKCIDPSASTLRRVRILTLQRTRIGQAKIYTYLHLAHMAFKSDRMRGVKDLRLEYLRADPTIPLVPFERVGLTSLEIYESIKGPEMLQLLPTDLSKLRNLRLTFRSKRVNLDAILSRLSDSVEHFTVVQTSIMPCPFRLEEYFIPSSIPNVPLDQIARFSSLRLLELRAFLGPSLTLLQHLASSCPLLTVIDFTNSFWISHDPHLALSRSDLYFETVFPESDIIKELRKMTSLQSLHLGNLPSEDPEDYEDLRSEMKKRGIKCEWEVCWDEGIWCDNCGDYHEY